MHIFWEVKFRGWVPDFSIVYYLHELDYYIGAKKLTNIVLSKGPLLKDNMHIIMEHPMNT